jgi:1-acyl-sn-glycerol-3-phosphate acyltransferase
LTVEARSLFIGQRVQESRAVDSSSTLVSCGAPLPGHDVRIVDTEGREVDDRTVGILHFRGPSVTEGYRKNEAANRKLIQGEWRDSGDLAVRVDGEFFIVGRVKDLIIRAGRNIAPQDVEEEVSQIDGVRKGCVVAYSDSVPAAEGTKGGSERFVIVAETHLTDEVATRALADEIRVRVVTRFDIAPDLVDLVGPRTIPKTSSGKLRRAECRERHRSGTLRVSSAGRLSGVRIFAHTTVLRLRDLLLSIPSIAIRSLWMLWCGGWFLVLAVVLMGVVLVGRNPVVSRRVARRLAQWWLRLVKVPHSIEGVELIPETPCVVMSNHQSYLDAVVLTALLPERFSFVAKRDFANGWFFRWALPQLGVRWIERSDVTQSAEDIDTLRRELLAGQALVIFPQGGFWRDMPDLPFKMGGFVLAGSAGVPVVPLALLGTEKVLPEGTWVLEPGAVWARIGPPQLPMGKEWSNALMLKQLTENAVRDLREARMTGGSSRGPACG